MFSWVSGGVGDGSGTSGSGTRSRLPCGTLLALAKFEMVVDDPRVVRSLLTRCPSDAIRQHYVGMASILDPPGDEPSPEIVLDNWKYLQEAPLAAALTALEARDATHPLVRVTLLHLGEQRTAGALARRIAASAASRGRIDQWSELISVALAADCAPDKKEWSRVRHQIEELELAPPHIKHFFADVSEKAAISARRTASCRTYLKERTRPSQGPTTAPTSAPTTP
jgi:hypothetical protein